MSTILLVGGGGYVGAVLAQELLERGYAVRILDRLYFGDQGQTGIRDRVELSIGDMRLMSPALLDDVEAVVNVGGLSNDPTAEYNPKANYEMNTTASVALARMARDQGVRRYLYASSCSIYDRGVADEARDVLLDEKSDVDPPGAYAGSKLAAMRVRGALQEIDIPVEIKSDYTYRGVRNYRVSGHKLDRTLDVAPAVTVEESVQTMVREIRRHNYTDFDNPRYYNISWMKLLQEAQGVIQVTGSVFDLPKGQKPLREVGS